MAVPVYRKACNYGRLVSWSNESMSGVWLFDDFRFDEDLTGNVMVMFGWKKYPDGSDRRFWHTTNAVQIHGCQELGNEGELMDPPAGFVNEWQAVIQDVFKANADRIFGFIIVWGHMPEDELIAASIIRQEQWHAEQIAHAERHSDGSVELQDGEQW